MNKKDEAVADKKAKAFPLSVLRKECRKLFDVSTSTFDGATCQLDQNQEYTVEEIKNTIEKWKGRSVKDGRR